MQVRKMEASKAQICSTRRVVVGEWVPILLSRVLDRDLGNIPVEHQAPVALCDDHILIGPLQDPRLNRSSSREVRIQNAVSATVRRASEVTLHCCYGLSYTLRRVLY